MKIHNLFGLGADVEEVLVVGAGVGDVLVVGKSATLYGVAESRSIE